MSFRLVSVSVIVLSFALAAAEARRGFSSGGSGSGTYDGAASTSSWDLSATPDADCIAIFGQSCSALTSAQKEEVAGKTASAQAASYTNYADYETANAKGYQLTADDGAQWSNAKSPGGRGSDTTTNAQWDADCNLSFSSSGGCDGLTKTQFATIDHSSAGRAPALTVGYGSYSDWQTASALNYTMSADDATLWGQANDGSVSAAACDAEFAGKACNELTKPGFQNAKSSNALMTAKIAKVTAGTLTNQDLTDLSISFTGSALSSPLSAWQLDYLETVLGTTASTTKADWQTTIDNYSAAAASKWYVYKIATSSATSGTYATSNATSALLNACGSAVASANTALGSASNSQISAHIRHANSELTSLTGAPTDTQLTDFLTEAVGFANGTSYADVSTATTSGWSAADYKTATNSSGWTNSSADSTAFGNCKSNTETITGGSNACSVSKSSWTAISAVASASGASSVSDSQIEAVIAAGAVTNSVFGDLTNLSNFEADYIRDCMGSTVTSTQINSCVTGGTTAKLNTQKVSGMIAGDYTGSPSVSDFENAGIGSVDTATGDQNVITFLKKSVCGTNGTSSCSAALGSSYTDSSLVSAKGSGSSTQTALLSYLKDALLEYNKSIIDTTPSPAAASGSSCGTVTLNVPAVCKVNPAFSCTAQSGWTMAANKQTISKSWGSTSGSISANITISRKAWWGGSGYSRVVTTSATLSDGGTIQYSFHNNGGNHPGFMSDLDNCFDAGGRILARNNKGSASGWPNSYSTYVFPNGSTNRDRAWWNARPKGEAIGRHCTSSWCPTSNNACTGPAPSSSYQNTYNISRLMAFSCSSLDNDHNGNFVCVKSACSN